MLKLSVEEISDEASFAALEKEWNAFLVRSSMNAPFLRHEWFRAWWKAFGGGRKMAVFIVKTESGRWAAAAPLMEEKGVRAGIPCRVLTSMSNDHSCRFDFLLSNDPRDDAGDAIAAIMEAIARRAPKVDLIELQDILSDSPTVAAFRRLAAQSGRRVGLRPTLLTPYIPVEGKWPDYFDAVSGHLKRNLRRRKRQLEEQGEISIERWTGDGLSEGDRLGDRLREGFEVEAMAWKGSAGTAIRENEVWAEFYRQWAQTAAERGWLRLYFLRLNDRPIAFYYTLLYDRKLYYLKLGYDPAYARYSPGILLHQEILESLFQEKATELDFLGPMMEWKREWARGERAHVWFYYFQRGFRPRLIHSIKFGLLPYLKRLRRAAERGLKNASTLFPARNEPEKSSGHGREI
ncbi:MAG TPA: GNAT family N-acetyltransferase [Candidatus Manganitrophaceae bacterium]|nr:GNAT family N-acetyltransferase [Candidatus Manganitrophaceae bacterium]